MTFSIGDVLEQLSDEFPDVTVSKIRFLESQGLIAPMRTASGFRMFSDTDITKLQWILLHQRDRFLPLKVIKEYLAELSDDAFADGNLPNFDFEGSGTLLLEGSQNVSGAADLEEKRSHLHSVPNDERSDMASVSSLVAQSASSSTANSKSKTALLQEIPKSVKTGSPRSAQRPPRPIQTQTYDSVLKNLDIESLIGSTEAMSSSKSKPTKRKLKADSVLSLEKMVIETGISGPQLKDLVKFGVLEATGSGNQMVFHSDEIAMALIVAPLLERGIEVRHIRNYSLFAAREVGFLEHVVQDDLRKRNPQAQEIAQEKARQFIQDTAKLKEMLLLRELKKEAKS